MQFEEYRDDVESRALEMAREYLSLGTIKSWEPLRGLVGYNVAGADIGSPTCNRAISGERVGSLIATPNAYLDFVSYVEMMGGDFGSIMKDLERADTWACCWLLNDSTWGVWDDVKTTLEAEGVELPEDD